VVAGAPREVVGVVPGLLYLGEGVRAGEKNYSRVRRLSLLHRSFHLALLDKDRIQERQAIVS